MKTPRVDKSMPARRSYVTASLSQFRATRFRHKTEGRGGTINDQAELLGEYEVFLQDNAEEEDQTLDCND